jgi:hypothetical protein
MSYAKPLLDTYPRTFNVDAAVRRSRRPRFKLSHYPFESRNLRDAR